MDYESIIISSASGWICSILSSYFYKKKTETIKELQNLQEEPVYNPLELQQLLNNDNVNNNLNRNYFIKGFIMNPSHILINTGNYIF